MPAKNNRRALRRKNGLQARQPAEPIRPLRSFLGAPFGVIPSCGLVLHRERASTASLVSRVGGSVQARVVGGDKLVGEGVSARGRREITATSDGCGTIPFLRQLGQVPKRAR